MRYLKAVLLFIYVSFFWSATNCQSRSKYYLLIGSYTKPADDKGIAVYEFDAKDGSLNYKSTVGGIENPSYLTISNKRNNVYAVSEKGRAPGVVVSYMFDRIKATLKKLNEVAEEGRGPCYISTGRDDKHVFVANYGDGSIAAIGINKNGSLDSTGIQSIQHTGSSLDKDNQAGPHAHSILTSPDNRFALSADLGSDRIYLYHYNADKQKPLIAADPGFVSVTPGSGPRHICFHPNGHYAYVVNELAGSIHVFDYKAGSLKEKQLITMLPDGYQGIIEAADIHISPDGKFLYASNREERNELAIYAIAKDGRLKFIDRQSTMGTAPRNFAIDPTGKFLLVANMRTNEVIVFRRNMTTGLLKLTEKKIQIDAPACLKFFKQAH